MFSKETFAELREKNGYSQTALSKLIYVSQPHIAAIELGYKKPSSDLLHRLSELYGCSMDDFYTKD